MAVCAVCRLRRVCRVFCIVCNSAYSLCLTGTALLLLHGAGHTSLVWSHFASSVILSYCAVCCELCVEGVLMPITEKMHRRFGTTVLVRKYMEHYFGARAIWDRFASLRVIEETSRLVD